MSASFNAAINNFNGWGDHGNTGGTNWEDGFNTVDPLFPRPDTKPDLILFMTDGNPTTHNGSIDLGTFPGTDDLWAGMREANQHKSEGTRVVGIGIGDGLSEPNIAKISGPTQGSDYFLVADFDDLETLFVKLPVGLYLLRDRAQVCGRHAFQRLGLRSESSATRRHNRRRRHGSRYVRVQLPAGGSDHHDDHGNTQEWVSV